MNTYAEQLHLARISLAEWEAAENLSRVEHPEWWEMRNGRLAQPAEHIRRHVDGYRKIVKDSEAAIARGEP